ANPDESVYTLSAFGDNRGEGMMWLWGKDLNQVSISGTGTIDGNGPAFMGAELDDSYELKPVTDFDPRPHLLTLINADRTVIRDVTIRNSAYWTIHLVGCYDAVIDGISLLNNLKIRNGDGIDVDHSRKVRITGCFIESGDDCICLKNRREYEEYGPCEDVVVTNCVMTSRSCAVKIGSENMDRISGVMMNNCIIRDSNRGIGIQNRDEGTVTDVTFSNMLVDCRLFSDVWWGKSEPIYVTSYPRADGNHKDANWRFPKGATQGRCGEVAHITFDNVRCVGENGVFVGGDSIGKVHNLIFRNVDIRLENRTDYPKGVYDKRPCKGEGFVSGKAYAFFIDTASDIKIDDCRYQLVGFPTDMFGGEFKIENSVGVNISGR
ncbi:MAG: glycoside hydrolase family 28 protein, partial [Muribaculaceae bacterium]|nr:glycoside hydrolase family 28 protein [Muribaculaceae bacterium]